MGYQTSSMVNTALSGVMTLDYPSGHEGLTRL